MKIYKYVIALLFITLAACTSDFTKINTNPNAGSVFGFAPGFDEMVELYGRRRPGYVALRELVTRSDEVTQRALEWIEQAPHPFFLMILTTDPHAPYAPPKGFDRYRGDPDAQPGPLETSIEMSPEPKTSKEVWLGRTLMSRRELRRAGVLARVQSGELKLVDAAKLLEVSYRQTKRLWQRYGEEGPEGLKHRSAGKRSNRVQSSTCQA